MLHLLGNKTWSPGSRGRRTRGSSLISLPALLGLCRDLLLQVLAAVPLTCSQPGPLQASAMSPPLRSLLLLALALGLAGTLNPKDPNTCSFWER